MKRWMMVVALTLGLSCLASIQACAAEGAGKAEKSEGPEVKVKLADYPKPVQDTLNKEIGAGTLKDIDKETENGKTIYEADATIDGKPYEIKVSEDGALIGKKLDDEKDEGDKKDEKGDHDDKK